MSTILSRPLPVNWFIVTTVLQILILSGCGQKEIQKLRSENEVLKNKVVSLEQEVQKLKETADYHYQRGSDLMSKENYVEAKTEFIVVIEKYPISPLVASAKQQLIKVNNNIAKTEAKKKAEERRILLEKQRELERQGIPVSIEDVLIDPDKYYNRRIRVSGKFYPYGPSSDTFEICPYQNSSYVIGVYVGDNKTIRKFVVNLIPAISKVTVTGVFYKKDYSRCNYDFIEAEKVD